VLHVSGAKILEAVMPQAKIALLEAVGHLPMVEQPVQSAGLYLRFLSKKIIENQMPVPGQSQVVSEWESQAP
jgi:hypothetical protein